MSDNLSCLKVAPTQPSSDYSMPNPIVAVLRPYWQYRDLLLNLVIKDFKVRYQGAALGFIWSLGNPLALIALYDIVFTHIFRSNLHHYVLYLVIGVLHFNLFAGSVTQSCESLTGSAGLLQKIYFPRILMPTASFLFNIMLWSVAILVLVICYPFLGGEYHWVLLLYPLMLGMYMAFIWGLVIALSVLHVEFRDIKHLVEIAMMFLFWLTPIVYDPSTMHPDVRDVVDLNPLTQFFDLFHAILYQGVLPGWNHLLYASAWTVISLAAGMSLFQRRARHVVEDL